MVLDPLLQILGHFHQLATTRVLMSSIARVSKLVIPSVLILLFIAEAISDGPRLEKKRTVGLAVRNPDLVLLLPESH